MKGLCLDILNTLVVCTKVVLSRICFKEYSTIQMFMGSTWIRETLSITPTSKAFELGMGSSGVLGYFCFG